MDAEPSGAATRLPQVARPGFALLAGHRGRLAVQRADVTFDSRTRPHDITGLDAACFDAADDAKLAARHAVEDQGAVRLGRHDQRSRREREAGLEVVDGHGPDGFAGLGVESNELGVQRAEDELVVDESAATVDDVAARQNAFGQTMIVLPKLTARLCIDGPGAAVGTREVDHAVLHEGLRLLALHLLAAERHGPSRHEVLNVL